ncbi:MAG TPA: CPBP family intramembrane glutamic endopeptidase [Pirellulales bacterium]|jgi:membrane protease YdiL (CAAX protease family)|nr:CPBP family intramembrane glutamic endopeptidase [Pirellulales bacterium]
MNDAPLAPRESFFRAATLFEGALLGLALVLGYFSGQQPLELIRWSARDFAYGLLATAPMLLGLLIVTRIHSGPLGRLNAYVREWVVPLFAGCSPWQLAVLSLLAGVSEEALFRGVVQGWLMRVSGSPIPGLVFASALFGLAHAITSTYAILAGLIGAYLGWLWLATDNLLVPAVAHAAYDFVALMYLLRAAPPIEQGFITDD